MRSPRSQNRDLGHPIILRRSDLGHPPIDSKTMREFDRACLTPVMELSPAAIRRIRAKAAVSQAVFAAHLNVTTGVVSKWERGEKQPSGPAAKLLTLAAKNGIAAIA